MNVAAGTLDHADAWQPAVNPWIIAVAVTLATFMEVLDTSIANVALPHIAGSLSAGQDESTWVLTSYLVSNAIVLPLSGWLSSIVGRKNFYMGCVALFTISSFLCGLAPNLAVLIICRVLQGAGGGGLQPSEQAILADTFPPAKRGMAFAVYGIAVVTAPAIGPTLGGWITDNFTWRWIFFINIPVGMVSVLLTSRLIQDPPYLRRRKLSETKIDYVGLGFVALGLGALQIVLDKGQRDDWFESHFILILSIVAAASLIFVVFWEWRHKDPIIDLHLFRDRTFGVSNLLMFMLGFALLGSTLLLPLFMQTMLGYTAEQAGLALMPGGFTIMLLLPLVGFLLSRFPYRRPGAGHSSRRNGLPVCSHQYRGLCLSPPGEEQCRFGLDESGKEYWRQCGDFCGHHLTRSADTGPYHRFGEPYFGFEPGIPVNVAGCHTGHAGPRCERSSRHPAGLCFGSVDSSASGHHAGLHRLLLVAWSGHHGHDSDGLPDEKVQARRRYSSTLENGHVPAHYH